MNQKKALKKMSGGLVGALAIAGGTSAYGVPTPVAPPPDLTAVAPATTTVNWDVNSDGIIDFVFQERFNNTATGTGLIWQANMNPFTLGQSSVISYAGAFVRYAFALQLGAFIGPGDPRLSTVAQITLGSRYRSAGVPSYYGGFAADGRTPGTIANGAVAAGTQAYAGFSFTAADGVHFGYVRLSTSTGLIDFTTAVYESAPRVGITIVPEPGTLAMLAVGGVGALGMAIKRRRRA